MKPNFDTVTIIYNPNATGDAPELARELKADLKAALPDLPVELKPTKEAGHAVELARHAAKSGKALVISVSGDGGYNEVVNGVMAAGNPDATAAVLPAGNANDHARTLHDQPLIELIKAGKTKKIDLLQMTIVSPKGDHKSRFAHSYIGFGITPVVAVELEKGGKGSIREALTTIKAFHKFEPFTVEYPDGSQAEVDSLVFANINQMAKVATLSTDGEPDDGVFEVIAQLHQSDLQAVATAIRAAITDLGEQPSVRSYEFKTHDPMPAQLDGEIWELSEAYRVVIRCQRQALRTLVG